MRVWIIISKATKNQWVIVTHREDLHQAWLDVVNRLMGIAVALKSLDYPHEDENKEYDVRMWPEDDSGLVGAFNAYGFISGETFKK